MGNSLMLIPFETRWQFAPEQLVAVAMELWPAAVVKPCPDSECYTHQVTVDDRTLLISIGPGHIAMQTSLDLDDCGRLAFAAAQTAPPAVDLVYMDDGNCHALKVSCGTPLAAYLRILDAGPL